MVVAKVKGALINWYALNAKINTIRITCSDPAVKEILLELDNKDRFIIEDLDDHHLFIDLDKLDVVREHVERVLEQNIFRSN